MNRQKKILLISLLSLLMVVTIAFLLYILYDKARNSDLPPVISISSDEIHVSVNAGEKELLMGVTAMDAEDGDITDRILIESISSFIDVGKCNITYAVFDSHNQAATASRVIYFTDYTSPRFEIKHSLDFSYTSSINPLDFVKAYDCIDGDISGKVSMSLLDSSDYLTAIGSHRVEFRVVNSMGDAAAIQTEIIVTDRTYTEQRMIPVIELSDYIIYVKRGELVDPLEYVSTISIQGQEFNLAQYGANRLQVDTSGFDSNETGLQQIIIYTESEEGNGAYVGHATLLVYVLGDNE